MHNLDVNSNNVPAFLIKLWKLVEDSDTNDLISWSDQGNSFIIRNQAMFAKELLPQYFKHSNMASFIRQLNMYGFRKLVNYEKSGLKNESDEMEFHQPFFMRGQEGLLELIKRKIPRGGSEPQSTKATPKDILTDLTSIQEKQESMNNLLISIKKENELLWRELSSLRQKHNTQEQIIQKVIQFLLSLVQTKQNIGVKRKLHHMIQGSPTPEPKKSHMARCLNDLVIAVPQDKSSSPIGPVIHEVIDHDESEISGKVIPAVNMKGKNAAFEFSNSDSEISSDDNQAAAASGTLDALSLFKPLELSSNALLSPASNDELVLGLPRDIPSSSAETLNGTINSSPKSISYTSAVSPTDVIAVHDYSRQVPIPEDIANVVSIPEDGEDIENDPDLIGDTISLSNSSPITITIPNNEANTLTSPTATDAVLTMEKPTDAEMLNCIENLSSVSSSETSNVISIPDSDTSLLCFPNVATPGGSAFPLDFPCVSPVSSGLNDSTPVNDLPDKNAAVLQTPNAIDRASPFSNKANEDSIIDSLLPEKKKKKIASIKAADNLPVTNHSFPAEADNQNLANDKQLAVPEFNSDSSLSKNMISNHLINVEEDLERLKCFLGDQMYCADFSTLLGLFSTDDGPSNTILANQLALDDHTEFLKDADNNIIGNELVQLPSSMQGIEEFINEPDLLNYLDVPQEVSKYEDQQKDRVSPSTTLLNIKREKDLDNYTCPFSMVPNSKTSKISRNRSKRKAK